MCVWVKPRNQQEINMDQPQEEKTKLERSQYKCMRYSYTVTNTEQSKLTYMLHVKHLGLTNKWMHKNKIYTFAYMDCNFHFPAARIQLHIETMGWLSLTENKGTILNCMEWIRFNNGSFTVSRHLNEKRKKKITIKCLKECVITSRFEHSDCESNGCKVNEKIRAEKTAP